MISSAASPLTQLRQADSLTNVHLHSGHPWRAASCGFAFGQVFHSSADGSGILPAHPWLYSVRASLPTRGQQRSCHLRTACPDLRVSL